MSGTAQRPARPELRIIYRSHGGENAKGRPPYYSKLLALASVVRAVREVGAPVHVVFLNDGPVPGERLEIMREIGKVAQISEGSNRGSYRTALEMAARSSWADSDLLWLAEDDYLYQPFAFRALVEAAAALPEADYLSVYGRTALDLDSPREAPRGHSTLGVGAPDSAVTAGGLQWYRGVSTTSTFGVRLDVLREDRALLRALPFTGGAWDHTTCLTVQGLQPFSWEQVRGEILPVGQVPVQQWPVALAKGAVHAAVNLTSRRPEARRRKLFLCDPPGAVHLEESALSCSTDWSVVAAATRAWAAAEGLNVGSPEVPTSR